MSYHAWNVSQPRVLKALIKGLRLALSTILVMGVCLSAVAPVRPVVANSPGSQTQAIVDVCTSPVISMDTTWSTGNIYQANCVVTVNAGVTLTVEAGAVVQFGGSGRGLKVFGTLNVVGAEGNPAVFTSSDDTSANSWYGIVLYENSTANLNYASIRFGGSGVCAGEFPDTYYNSCWGRAQVDVRRADLTMDHSEVRDGDRDGVVLDTPGRTPSIQNTTIANNTNGNPDDMIGLAVYQSSINMQPTYFNLTFTGNDRNKVIIWIPGPDYNLTQNVILGGAPVGFGCGFTGCVMQIPAGISLTIQPGAVLDMTTVNSGFRVLSGGSLLLAGTELNPISLIKGFVEVAFGGFADLNYCDLDGLGSVGYGLYLRSDDVTVSSCSFHNFAQYGVYVYAEASRSLHISMTNVDILNNSQNGMQMSMSAGGSIDMSLDGGSISDNLRNGVAISSGVTNLSLKNIVISNNGSPDSVDWTGRNGILAMGPNISLILENVQFNDNVNESIYWNCNGSITAKNLSASGNARDALNLAGCTITTGREWDLADADIPVIATGGVTIVEGGVLSIKPGTTLGFEAGKLLKVDRLGALYALGTVDKPIVFSRAYETQTGATAWRGLENYKGTMILRHCEVAYSNYDSPYGGEGFGIILGGTYDFLTNTIIQNCKIHDNDYGISAQATVHKTTKIEYNEIYNNPVFGIVNSWYGPDSINAYFNYWGSPTGPKHASNPDGNGDKVADGVNFIPFLTAPPEDQTLPGDMMVSSGGPAWISPGEVNDYAIQYLNLKDQTVTGAVAMIQLPITSKYLSSTEGGTYWPARHQVFWLLGDIAPGSQGMLTARVRFDWGLPGNYKDGSYTVLAGSNYQSDQLNLAEYTEYDPDKIADLLPMDKAAFLSLLPSNADLNALYNAAIGEGFVLIEASQTDFEDGSAVNTGYMRTPDKKLARMLNLSGNEALAITTNGSTFFKIEDPTSGQLTNLLTLERYTWGDWADAQGTNGIQTDCNYARCMRNCSFKTISIAMMENAAEGAAVWMLGLPSLVPVLGWGLFGYELLSLTHDVYVCHAGCYANPLTGCCNPGDVLWSPSSIGGNKICERYDCGSSNSFPPFPNRNEGCGTGFRCVAGNDSQGGCKPCTEGAMAMSVPFGPQFAITASCSDNDVNAGLPRCRDLGIRVAKDPNALFGPVGDVLPTDTINYRVTYENEGAGVAFEVYILNELPEQLDETTLVINNGGVYMPAERQIFWYIGQLGPKGDPTSKGEVTYSVQLKPGLMVGSAVVNQAVVYFPTVPEETPTNTWTNLVYPLVATPQSLETNYMTPIAVTLAGRPEGSLTFDIVSSPMGGLLSGEAPNLTYTPLENFSGVDFFTFTASVNGETSQSAQVTINVLTTGDTTSPTVLWVEPGDGEENVAANGSPVYVIPEGNVYSPVLVAKFSEQLMETTINSASVFVTGPGGVLLPNKATFEPGTNQLTIQVLTLFKSFTSYTVTLTSDITDQAGNPLAADYSWEFTTGQVKWAGGATYLPVILR